jgi:dual oxidase
VPTGITGYILALLAIALAVFALKKFRTHFFFAFTIIHQITAFSIITLTLIHGWAQLVQNPLFHTFLIGPLFLYSVDKLISLSILKTPLRVVKAEWLPSEVLHLEFEKPKSFSYKAGQWFRIACPTISSVSFHPFTITSAPNERHLSAHIRAVGPWTKRLRDVYNPSFARHPPVLIDGPFGSTNENWHLYQNVIFIGAGIGVTPYASILKDFIYRCKNSADFQVDKFIFFWVCRSQRQFEWLVDIIHEAEAEDIQDKLEVHIFVTELQEKFDLRTIMLYICEKQFFKVHNASLFTGLQASTHFGRPNFVDLFSQIQSNIKTDLLAVFSCTPINMIEDITDACDIVNRKPGARFQYFNESFY